ncbi:PREDICTED: uncharacterized protein LOC108376563 [Rhagoletis zephyria]|uniref:uncharacterized protein LOC108376563 n=1 Tax=Rhagoletis zephyria TaxID=28612 RepID=UPI000811823D|nr:PREDICTED: uncharacterized protein LOC108376563 [Rhagoletis zephyria]
MRFRSINVFIVTIVIFRHLPISTCGKLKQYPKQHPVIDRGNDADNENISFLFYKSAFDADKAKSNLQGTLRSFLENLQKNLTTSAILKTLNREVNLDRSQEKKHKLNDHLEFFRTLSHFLKEFSVKAEYFLQTSKNESITFLSKLRRVPTSQQVLTRRIKLQLTTYFAEMEFFNVLFFGIIDEGIDYIINALRTMQITIDSYTDIQRDILHNWNLEIDDWCYNLYFEFLQKWSTLIYKCAIDLKLQMVYNVYAMTETVIRHVMRQVEFKTQRLFNCLIQKGSDIKCSFLCHPEDDFEELFTSLKDLQIYYDMKINRGRVRTKRLQGNMDSSSRRIDIFKLNFTSHGFTEKIMRNSYNMCFKINKN